MKLPKLPVIAWSLPVIIAIILGIGFIFKSCQKPSPDKLPPAIVKTIDSLDTTKPAFDRTQDSLRKAAGTDTLAGIRHKVAANQFEAAARRIRARADTLAGVAEVHNDSAALWRAAYEERTREAEALRATVAQTDSAYQAERNARIALSTAYGADTLRRIAVEKLNAGLRKTIDELERPCKFARFIPCPSRTTTAVVSAIVGATAGYELRRP